MDTLRRIQITTKNTRYLTWDKDEKDEKNEKDEKDEEDMKY